MLVTDTASWLYEKMATNQLIELILFEKSTARLFISTMMTRLRNETKGQ